MDLKALIAEARVAGWSSGSGSMADLTGQARRLNLEQVSNRRGVAPVSVLRPTTPEDALPFSLSAQFGLGAQPLHTDGAHQVSPPDVVVLMSETPSATPTWLRRIGGRNEGTPWDDLNGGMFLVGVGPSAFFAPASDGGGGIRFDPGCMSPCDSRARAAATFLSDTTNAVAYEWTEPGQVLVVDNSRTLHARGAVESDDLDRELLRIAFRKARS